MKNKIFIACIFSVIGFHSVYAQTDSLVFKNANVMVGELKNMDRGVVTVETDYSDKDFKIEWEQIDEIYTTSIYLITLSDGTRINGYLKSIDQQMVRIVNMDYDSVSVDINDIVYLNAVDKNFLSRLYASIDFAYSFTKANHLTSLDIRSNIGYLADRWSADATYSKMGSSQDSVESTQRTDISLTFRYFLPDDWFAIADISFLSNTEQKLDLRSNGKLGVGKFFVHTNHVYWAFQGGASVNIEQYAPGEQSASSEDRQSMEGFFGTELNMFNIGDLSLLTNAIAYPSLTESGRWRYDVKFDVKYDLPLDLYLKLGFTINYDNQPVQGASELDYIFQTSLGWKW